MQRADSSIVPIRSGFLIEPIGRIDFVRRA